MLLKQLLKQQFHDTICGTLADAPLNDTLRELAACLRQLEEARLELGSSAVPEKNLFNPTQFDRTEIIRDGDSLSCCPSDRTPARRNGRRGYYHRTATHRCRRHSPTASIPPGLTRKALSLR